MVDYSHGSSRGSGALARTGVGTGPGIGARLIRAGSFIPPGAVVFAYILALPKVVIPTIVVAGLVSRTRLLILPVIAGVLWIGALAACSGLAQVAPSAADRAAIVAFAHSLEPASWYGIAAITDRWEAIPASLLVVWICAITLATWAVYRWDKHRAALGWARVSERRLLGLAAAGGVFGAILGVYGHYHRHKAQKRTFVFALMLIVGLYVGLGVLLFHLEGIPLYR